MLLSIRVETEFAEERKEDVDGVRRLGVFVCGPFGVIGGQCLVFICVLEEIDVRGGVSSEEGSTPRVWKS
ncbi:hypothetical protein LXL04_021831 [Taraxacum kok-saghyz]